MVLTIRIICIVGKINIPLPKIKEGHECGFIHMVGHEREQFTRFLYLMGNRHNRWLNYIPIDVNTPKDILYYLHSCVKK